MASELTPAIREAVDALFTQGVTKASEIVDTLAQRKLKINAMQVGGLWTLWRRKKAAEPGAPKMSPDPLKRAARAQADADDRLKLGVGATDDGFNWSGDGKGGGLGFGQSRVEVHVTRIAPANDGFLGVEEDGLTPDQLGRKYGWGTYDLVKYVNGTKIATSRISIAKSYGDPRAPRNPAVLPRLVPRDEDAERATHRAPEGGAAGHLGDVVQTFKTLKDIAEADRTGTKGAEAKVVERALEVAMGGKGGPGQDALERVMKEQATRDAAERTAERERETARRTEERERWGQIEKEREAAHVREMERVRTEVAASAQRDRDYRDFMQKNEKDREARLEKVIQETNESVQGLQVAMKDELDKNLAHQRELAKIERDRLDSDRTRDTRELAQLKEHQQQLFELQRQSLPGAGSDKATEMIVGLIQNALAKVETKANEILQLKKLEKVIAALGPENAQQLAAAFMRQGGIDLGSFLGGRGPAAPGARPAGAEGAAAGGEPKAAAKEDPKGEGMNGIAQQVYGTPFFRDLLSIWSGHLRMKRTPYLFANQLCGYMLEDRRVELFYNYMAGLTWPEFLAEIRDKVEPARLPFFEAPEAQAFFDAVIDLVAQRVEKDHIERNIVPRQAAASGAAMAVPSAEAASANGSAATPAMEGGEK
jgi:hypothetical protein